MIDNQIERIIRGTLGLLIPVPRLSLPVGAEKEFRLPSDHRRTGRFKLWRNQWGWLEAVGDLLV
jgi:hypothetical protein